jgi:hypothetical protein
VRFCLSSSFFLARKRKTVRQIEYGEIETLFKSLIANQPLKQQLQLEEFALITASSIVATVASHYIVHYLKKHDSHVAQQHRQQHEAYFFKK